jgi:hypothetical protein
VQGIEASLSAAGDRSVVRWSWEPDLLGFQEQQVACPTDEQALALAEHVLPPREGSTIEEGPNGGVTSDEG